MGKKQTPSQAAQEAFLRASMWRLPRRPQRNRNRLPPSLSDMVINILAPRRSSSRYSAPAIVFLEASLGQRPELASMDFRSARQASPSFYLDRGSCNPRSHLRQLHNPWPVIYRYDRHWSCNSGISWKVLGFWTAN
jgi:hypothetical protein